MVLDFDIFGSEDGTKDGLEFDASLPRHSDIGIENIEPFIIELSDSEEEDVYSPPPAKSVFTGQDTQLPAHGGDKIEDNVEPNSPFPRPSDAEQVGEHVGLGECVMEGNGDVSPSSIDVVDFGTDFSYLEPEQTTFTSHDIPVAEQVEPDQATAPMTDDDVVMMDIPTASTTDSNEVLGSVEREKVVATPSDETKQAPVLPDDGRDTSLPSWMAAVFQPDLLHRLRACNLKGITLEREKIHLSFA